MFDAMEVIGRRVNRNHNLARTGAGEAMMAYQGETPWHNLGTAVAAITSVEQALDAAHMNWEAVLAELFYERVLHAPLSGQQAPTERVAVPDRKAVLRGDTRAYLGTVGPLYTPIQNRDAFSVFDDVCRDHGVTIESVGAIGNGALTWMLAKLPGQSRIGGIDAVDNYILTVNAHDGSRAHHSRLTRQRVVCQNTLAIALASGSDFVKVAHFKSAKQRVDEAKAIVNRMLEGIHESDELFDKMLERRMRGDEVGAYINEVLGIDDDKEEQIADGELKTLDERRRTIAELVWTGRGMDVAGSDDAGTTAWAAYNAVVEYFDHVRPAEAKSESGRRKANESALWGAAAGIKLEAFKAARQLVVA